MKDTNSLEQKAKQIRDVFKNRGPLYIDPKYKRKGFVCRWVNDKDGNLEDFMNLGYEPVKRKVPVGDETASISHPLGSVVTKGVGGMTAVLMEIPQELHELIQQKKEEKNAEYDRSLKHTGIPTQIGEMTLGNK